MRSLLIAVLMIACVAILSGCTITASGDVAGRKFSVDGGLTWNIDPAEEEPAASSE